MTRTLARPHPSPRGRARRYTFLDHLLLAGVVGAGSYVVLHLFTVPAFTAAAAGVVVAWFYLRCETAGQAYWGRLGCAFRGLAAVAVMLLTALDEVATALLGLPALTPRLRRWWRLLTDEYRRGSMRVIDAEIIDDSNEKDEEVR